MENRDLYIEAFSGLSGDMLLGALCGLADYYAEIVHLPERLHLPDGKVEINTVNKNGIVCKHVVVIDLHQKKEHSHETHKHHDHSHNHDHTSDHHHHDHDKGHHHDHDHDHDHKHDHSHRHLKDILKIISEGDITDGAKKIANEIFTIIGLSESKIHAMDLDTIHFHEVSGVDSIIDIVGCAVLIDHLNIKNTFCTPICTGFGMVKTQHGLLPVPAPATADILIGMPTYPGQEEGERVTPTGAAIVKFLDPNFTVTQLCQEKIAYGPGKKDFIGPNVVRLSLLTAKKKASLPLP